MAQLFPKWTNKLPILLLSGLLLFIFIIIFSFWYWGSPKYTDVGYTPIQPVPYSHKLHAGELQLDCRYCHIGVENTAIAGVPPTQTCMNCHIVTKKNSEKMALIIDSWENNIPIEWIRVHKSPDYVYFDHSAHVKVGVGCSTCHGDVESMEVISQVESLSMSWCVECHKNPAKHLRPMDQITNTKWKPSEDQLEYGSWLTEELNITPPLDCAGCHR